MIRNALLSLALIASQALFAPSGSSTSLSSAGLKKIEAQLLNEAALSPNGSASRIVEDYGAFSLMVVVRQGTLILITGGKMVGEHPTDKPGEYRAPSVDCGTEQTLHAGDIVHIPVNVPHWVKLPPNTTATYIAFKEKA